VGIELLGLGNVRSESGCIKQLQGISALRGMAKLMHTQHVSAQRPVLPNRTTIISATQPSRQVRQQHTSDFKLLFLGGHIISDIDDMRPALWRQIDAAVTNGSDKVVK